MPVETPLVQVSRKVQIGCVVVAGMSVFINGLMLVQPIFMFQVFDRVLASGRVETLVGLMIVAGFALLVMGALDALRAQVLARVSSWLERSLARATVAASVQDSLTSRDADAQGLRDLQTIRGFISSPAIIPAFDAPWTPLFIAIVWLMHPWLGMLALVSAVVLLGLALLNEMATRTPLQEANQRMVAALGQLEGGLRNAEVIQAMGMLPALLRQWERADASLLDFQTAATDRAGALMGFSKSLRVLVQVGVLGLGAYLVLLGELTAGGMIAGSILLARALAPVEQAISGWRGFVNARTAHQRLEQLLKRHPPPEQRTRLPAPSGQITVERLSYAPPGAKPILKGLSFEIAAGEVLAVVGPSASGKSTLCRLLVGTCPPTSGHVRLDGADAHAWGRSDLGRHVGYLPQDIELFAGTVKANIARLADVPDDEVVQAAQLAGAHKMILHLAAGYDTPVGPNGAVLSGGQRQRVGLARAVFGEPKLVVLDEPNANLDHEGDVAVLETVRRLKAAGATVVMVVHRPNLLAHADKLAVLREGSLALFGSRDEVLPQIAKRRSAAQRVAVGATAPQAARERVDA